MHETLILYYLLNGQNTMYGLTKTISSSFGYIIKPSFGTVQPALKRLEKKVYIKSDKFYTEGGKPYYYYSITEDGKAFLKHKLLSFQQKNPLQLISDIKIKLACSDFLEVSERGTLYKNIKTELLKHKVLSENIQKSDVFSNNFAARMILDNSVCELKNLIDLIEGLEKCLQ